jgi:hypothetical protein
MAFDTRKSGNLTLTILGEDVDVIVREIPFREGVELECEFEGETFRMGDRGLGIDEALRLLKVELERFAETFRLK